MEVGIDDTGHRELPVEINYLGSGTRHSFDV